jgi:small-conductance mechanosensitive channel
VSYHATPRETEQALLEAARHPLMLDEPGPSVLFKGFGTNTLDFELLVWTEEPDRIPALTSDLRYSIWDALDSHNIDLPFPPQPPAQSRPVPAPGDNSASA